MARNPYQGDDIDPFSGVRDEETGEIKRETPKSSQEAPKKQSFREAFTAARKAGDSTFMFGGKKYTTELKEEAKKPAKAEPAKAEPAKAEPAKAEPAKAEPRRSAGPREKFKRLMGALGNVKTYKSGGSVKSSASKRADGCAVRGKTKGKMV